MPKRGKKVRTEELFECDQCSKPFRTLRGLRMHIDRIHRPSDTTSDLEDPSSDIEQETAVPCDPSLIKSTLEQVQEVEEPKEAIGDSTNSPPLPTGIGEVSELDEGEIVDSMIGIEEEKFEVAREKKKISKARKAKKTKVDRIEQELPHIPNPNLIEPTIEVVQESEPVVPPDTEESEPVIPPESVVEEIKDVLPNSIESSDEEEIVVKRRRRKRKPRVIYLDDSSSEEEPIVVKTRKSRKAKQEAVSQRQTYTDPFAQLIGNSYGNTGVDLSRFGYYKYLNQ